MYISEIVLCAQPHPHQRSYQLDSLRATGVTLVYWAQSVWCEGQEQQKNHCPLFNYDDFLDWRAVTSTMRQISKLWGLNFFSLQLGEKLHTVKRFYFLV